METLTTMALTFLHTVESKGSNIAIKFESPTPETSSFMVTFLTAPHIRPFTMVFDEDRWRLPAEVPHEVREIEQVLLDAAGKFQR